MSNSNKATQFDRTIVEGPILKAVWKLAWPTMLQNMIAGLQGIVDHTMVGHLVGFNGNAAIGVSWQIFLVVVVFISSLYSGMGVLVARFAGAGDVEKVNRVVYQSFLTSVIISCGILAPAGYFLTPKLLDIVKAAPAVKAEALPYLRIMFVFSVGKLVFFMLGGALRTAGDAKTPLRLGVVMTILNLIANLILIPIYGTTGAAIGTVFATTSIAIVSIYWLFSGKLVVKKKKNMSLLPDLQVLNKLIKFGLPTGFQGIMVNIGGVLLLRFVGSLQHSAEAQAAYTVGYTQLFSLITWTSVGLMGATAAVAGQNLGAGQPERSSRTPIDAAKIGLSVAATIGLLFYTIPQQLLAIFGMSEATVLAIGTDLLQYLAFSGLFITVALAFTGGLQGTGDTRSPMYISLIAQIAVPIGICLWLQTYSTLEAAGIWTAILCGHFTRCTLSFLRFKQGKWQHIHVDLSDQPKGVKARPTG